MARSLATLVALSLLLPTGAATAHDHDAPKVFLRVAGQGQQGSPQSYCWENNNPDGSGVGFCKDYAGGELNAMAAPRGRRARVRFWDTDRPRRVRIRGWEQADARGVPLGPSTLFRRRLEPIMRHGVLRGWQAIFRLPDRTGDLFLTAKANYSKPDGSGGVVYWDFRLDLV